MSARPKASTPVEPKHDRDNKRSFASIFSSKLFGSAKSSGFPTEVQGIMFYKTHADTVNVKDTHKAAHYVNPKLGHSFILNDDQIERILAIANEGCKPEAVMDSGLLKKSSKEFGFGTKTVDQK